MCQWGDSRGSHRLSIGAVVAFGSQDLMDRIIDDVYVMMGKPSIVSRENHHNHYVINVIPFQKTLRRKKPLHFLETQLFSWMIFPASLKYVQLPAQSPNGP
jgi:hypothetical protein